MRRAVITRGKLYVPKNLTVICHNRLEFFIFFGGGCWFQQKTTAKSFSVFCFPISLFRSDYYEGSDLLPDDSCVAMRSLINTQPIDTVVISLVCSLVGHDVQPGDSDGP